MKTIREEISEHYGALIDAEIEAAFAEAEKAPIVPSKRFERRMRALLRRGGKAAPSRTKRILIIAAAALLALAMGACAVPEVRESIAGFFVKIFDDHAEYTSPNITKERIEEEYGLVPIPEGFEIVETSNNGRCRITTYSDINETAIQLIQMAKGFVGEWVDNELGVYYEKQMGDRTVRIYHSDYSSQATWIQDGYYFSLSYNAQIELEDFEALIGSVNEN